MITCPLLSLQSDTKSLTFYDPLTVDEVEAFLPVQKKLKLDTGAKPEGNVHYYSYSPILNNTVSITCRSVYTNNFLYKCITADYKVYVV